MWWETQENPHSRVGRHLGEVIPPRVCNYIEPSPLPGHFQNKPSLLFLVEAGVFRYPTTTRIHSSVHLEQLMLKGHTTNLHFFSLKRTVYSSGGVTCTAFIPHAHSHIDGGRCVIQGAHLVMGGNSGSFLLNDTLAWGQKDLIIQ